MTLKNLHIGRENGKGRTRFGVRTVRSFRRDREVCERQGRSADSVRAERVAVLVEPPDG